MGSPMPSVAFSPAVTASPAIVTISIADEAAEEAKLPYRQVHSGPGTESTGTGTSSGSPLQEDLTPAPIFKGIKTPKTVSLSRTLPPVLAKQTKPGPTRDDKRKAKQQLVPSIAPPTELQSRSTRPSGSKWLNVAKTPPMPKGRPATESLKVTPASKSVQVQRPPGQDNLASMALKDGKKRQVATAAPTGTAPVQDDVNRFHIPVEDRTGPSPSSFRSSAWNDLPSVSIQKPTPKDTKGYEKLFPQMELASTMTTTKTAVPLSEAPPLDDDDSEKVIVISKFSERTDHVKKRRRRKLLLICFRKRGEGEENPKRRRWIIVGVSVATVLLLSLAIGLGLYAFLRASKDDHGDYPTTTAKPVIS